MNLKDITIQKAGAHLRKKEISSVELVEMCLSKIRNVNAKLNVFITVNEEQSLVSARQADERLKNNDHCTPLTGIPLCLKDIFLTKGVRTTCGSKIL